MRESFGLFNACIGLLMCMTFAYFLSFMLQETLIDEKLVDLNLNTIKDYCVECTIPSGMYDAFSTARGGRDIKAFKEALIG